MITSPRIAFIRHRTRPILAGLLLATLAACGGNGQSRGGLIPPGTPSASATVAEGQAASAASGPGTAAPATSPSAPTIAEQFATLESSGAYPALDRSTDIAGPDTNKNGVRDDIEAWINAQPVNDAQRKALMQKARALQRTLILDLSDAVALQRSGAELMASTKCGGDVFKPRSEFSILRGKIEAMTANTRERATRYLKYNAASSGSSTSLPNGNTCEP